VHAEQNAFVPLAANQVARLLVARATASVTMGVNADLTSLLLRDADVDLTVSMVTPASGETSVAVSFVFICFQ